MKPEASTPLAASPAWLDRIAVRDSSRDWTWRELHSAACTLADGIEGTATIGNFCDSRAGFFITMLAALRLGTRMVLPPSSGQAEIATMIGELESPLAIADSDAALRGLPATTRVQLLRLEPRGTPRDDAALAWGGALDPQSVRLHTSGSTGRPQAQDRTVEQLVLGSWSLTRGWLDYMDVGVDALAAVVCSVPSQHMFGLEMAGMLPLVHGVPVLERQPLLPADVHGAFEELDGGGIWIATPLHLRAMTRAGARLPNCRLVISSTMPLAPGLAAEVEALCGTPVVEIYGSTETGALAVRRTAIESSWRALAGVRLVPGEEDTTAWGGHFTSPRSLADRIELEADGSFRLVGRQADMIKVAGRRTSLSALNLLLAEMPGLGDAVFFQPTDAGPAARLVLIHAGAPVERKVIEAWLRQRMDAVFLPRTTIRVARLPRTATGKLPLADLERIYGDWLASRREQ